MTWTRTYVSRPRRRLDEVNPISIVLLFTRRVSDSNFHLLLSSAFANRTIFRTARANRVLKKVSPPGKAVRIGRFVMFKKLCFILLAWMLTITAFVLYSHTECVLGHCSTGTRCGNQHLQEGAHVSLGLRPVDRKGVSLFAAHHVAQGELVAQYVGEVLTKEAYAMRERWVRGFALADMLSVLVTLCGAIVL
jgi:hypothetical protein